jgi:hypothetical protein
VLEDVIYNKLFDAYGYCPQSFNYDYWYLKKFPIFKN